MRIFPTLAVALACAAAVFPLRAMSEEQTPGQDQAEIADGLICDTPQQVERFASIFHGDADSALNAVNHESSPPGTKPDQQHACGIVRVAFLRGDSIRMTRTHDGFAQVVEVAVIAIYDGDWKVIQPTKQYTLLRPKGEEV
jgi:hypothetical protein